MWINMLISEELHVTAHWNLVCLYVKICTTYNGIHLIKRFKKTTVGYAIQSPRDRFFVYKTFLFIKPACCTIFCLCNPLICHFHEQMPQISLSECTCFGNNKLNLWYTLPIRGILDITDTICFVEVFWLFKDTITRKAILEKWGGQGLPVIL